MKKVIFLFAMVFALSFAMAQNNTADVNQVGNGNNGIVNQSGNSNSANVDQYGSNIAKVEQVGISNKGKIAQGASGASVLNNYVPGYPGDWKEGAFINQSGERNDAEIDVNVSRNGSRIDQLGNDNWAKQEVNSAFARTTNWDRMGVDINQEGNNNWANQKTIASFGTYGVQGMKINQDGNYNVADQLSIGGMSNATEIEQIGNNNNNPDQSGNTFNVSATGLANPLALSWAHKPVGNYTQYMFQNKGATHMYVEGNNNNTAQYQEYSVWSVSGQNDAWMDIFGSENNVAQGQLGDMNSSEIDIAGDDNVVTSSQFGDNNFVEIDLTGASNVVGVQQVGDFHSAAVLQTGNSNFAQVIQQ